MEFYESSAVGQELARLHQALADERARSSPAPRPRQEQADHAITEAVSELEQQLAQEVRCSEVEYRACERRPHTDHVRGWL